jgi:GH25 family lysozyme M1 (1,4-beta-N-acetylmuramidase)
MLLGIDVSKWQGEMDWHKARSAGARFAFVRAGSITLTGGNCYTDHQFERNARIAPDYMPIGFYWYFRPQHDPIKQANYFASLIRDKKYVLPPVIDLETDGDLNAEGVTESAKNFVIQVYNRLNVWCLMYSRAIWLNENTVPIELWKILDLWIARYKKLTGPWSDGYCIPRDYPDWKFWQFSAGGNGRGPEFGAKSRSIDLDYFNGDQKDFDLYIGAASSPHLVRIFFPLAASLRSGPEGPAIGATWRGAVWPVLGKSGDGKYFRVEAWLAADKVEEV